MFAELVYYIIIIIVDSNEMANLRAKHQRL